MTAIINTQNKPVLPDPPKPVLKAVAHPSKEIKPEHNTIHSDETTATEDEEAISPLQQENVAAENQASKEQKLDNAVKQLNSHIQTVNRNLQFNVDNDSGKTVVKVIDAETEELIRQIPNEEALTIAKQLEEKMMSNQETSGLLLSKIIA